jgi:hypothetical protein
MGTLNRGFTRIMALAAVAIAAGGRFAMGRSTLRSQGLGDDTDAVPASRNYGYRPGAGNRAHQRAALKKRNQARNRAAHRG